jgi:hypothetical protein
MWFILGTATVLSLKGMSKTTKNFRLTDLQTDNRTLDHPNTNRNANHSTKTFVHLEKLTPYSPELALYNKIFQFFNKQFSVYEGLSCF